MAQLHFREQVVRIREDAVVEAVNRLLATKGYDLMTVDEVAAEAGLSKASLYKHFASKEELAAAAMARALERAIAYADILLEEQPDASPLRQLEAVVRWTLQAQLDGTMPALPAQNSRLSASLRSHRLYMQRLMQLSQKLGAWIAQAQAAGELDAALPAEVILYTLFARACDPVLPMLRASGQHADAQIVDWLVATTFRGIGAAAPTAPAKTARLRRPPR